MRQILDSNIFVCLETEVAYVGAVSLDFLVSFATGPAATGAASSDLIPMSDFVVAVAY